MSPAPQNPRIEAPERSTGVEKRLFTVLEAAEYLGMTEWGVRGLIYNGKIPSVRNGRRVFLDIEDMNRWIEENKEKTELF